jgi:hypothetical protein
VSTPASLARGVEAGGFLFLPSGTTDEVVTAGSRKASAYATGTLSATTGSTAVTGSGTSWSANVDAGMILLTGSDTAILGIVKSVESDTALTLMAPANATHAGVAYRATPAISYALAPGGYSPANQRVFVAAGSRLLRCMDNRIYESVLFGGKVEGSTTYAFASGSGPQRYYPGLIYDPAEDFVELPQGLVVVGGEGVGGSAILFTTSGVWRLTNVAFEITDAYGNPQQQVEQINPDLILWGNAGIARYRGGLVVPAVDDVVLMDGAGATEPVSGNISPLYRSYVKAGYTPGLATVHRGHYFLPIVNGTTLVDVLVCRLDGRKGPGWVRWSGHAAGVGYARRISTARTPSLLGLNSTRVTDLSGCFSPASGNKSDADATAHVLSIVTRDYSAKAHVKAMWREVRARFELTDAASDNPTLTAEYAVGPVAGESWTSIGSWAEGTGEAPTRLAVGKSAQSIRFRLKSSGACASLAVRSLEVFFRGSRKR